MNLIFIKNWGTYKVGDIVKNPTEVTRKALVETHGVAEVQTDQELQTVLDQEIHKIEEEVKIVVKKAPKKEKSSRSTSPGRGSSRGKKKK